MSSSFGPDTFKTIIEGLGIDLSDNALAQDGPDALPSDVCLLGNDAIDEVAKYVCSCFKEGSEQNLLRGEEAVKLLAMFKFGDLQGSFSSFDDHFYRVDTFVAEIARYAKLNPILVTLAAAWTGLSEEEKAKCFPNLTEDRDAEVRHALAYCFLLHTIATTITEEPKGTNLPLGGTTFVEKLYNLFNEQKETVEWKPYFSLFEKAKEASVNYPIRNKQIPYKTGEKEIDDKASAGALLSINILEAMMQDTLQGYEDNAQCGFELMMESNDRKEIKGLDNGPDSEWVDDGRKTGVALYKSPLPTVWANIYSSWNLCFCSTYSNFPVFFAKLLNPATFGKYHKIDGMYLSPRVLTLYMHIQYVMLTRSDTKSKTPWFENRPWGDWRSTILSDLWGQANKEAARQYQVRIESIIDDNYGKIEEAKYDLKRLAVRPLWVILRETIEASQGTKNFVIKLFEKCFGLNLPGDEIALMKSLISMAKKKGLVDASIEYPQY